MNSNRKKRLKETAKIIPEIIFLLNDLREQIEEIKGEEEDYFENLSESGQESDKGQASESAISELDSVVASLDEVEDSLNSADSSINDLCS